MCIPRPNHVERLHSWLDRPSWHVHHRLVSFQSQFYIYMLALLWLPLLRPCCHIGKKSFLFTVIVNCTCYPPYILLLNYWPITFDCLFPFEPQSSPLSMFIESNLPLMIFQSYQTLREKCKTKLSWTWLQSITSSLLFTRRLLCMHSI